MLSTHMQRYSDQTLLNGIVGVLDTDKSYICYLVTTRRCFSGDLEISRSFGTYQNMFTLKVSVCKNPCLSFVRGWEPNPVDPNLPSLRREETPTPDWSFRSRRT